MILFLQINNQGGQDDKLGRPYKLARLFKYILRQQRTNMISDCRQVVSL